MAKKSSKRLDAVVHSGETLKISRSHEVRIDGDQNWVSCEVIATANGDETWPELFERTYQAVHEAVEETVKRTVTHVQEMSK